MTLFPNEKIVLESDNKNVVLTSHRIYQQSNGIASQETTSIMLEHISSCQTYTNYNWFMIAVAICVGIFFFSREDGEFGVILMAILVGVFYYTKKSTILIKSPTATINIETANLNQSAIAKFVDRVEQTKHERILNLNKKII